MRTKTKKIHLASLLILFLLFSPFTLRAQSTPVTVDGTVNTNTTITSPSPSDAAIEGTNAISDNMGLNQDTLKHYINSFNVSDLKITPPQVSLMFQPSNPEIGAKITATATPSYFQNEMKSMYFTWFLKNKDCDKTDDPSSEERQKCDLNNDGRVDIEDYKIKAMRIIANNGFNWENASYSHSDGNSSYKATFGGDDQRGKNHYCYVGDVTSGATFLLDCNTHFFPDAPHENTGDGSFGHDEEEFWHTDPTSADTAQTGNVDEANVTGLGINSFTWNYNSGDEVGVVVEGTGIESVQSYDSAYNTMWAAPNGLCNKTHIVDGTMSNVSDLNDCLYDSLVTPSENSASSNKINVTLSSSPTSPINDPGTYSDPNLSNGDELTVQSSVENATDNSYLQYSWQVFASDDPAPDSWDDQLSKNDLPGATQMEGLGLSTFKFKLNLASPKKYLDVKLTVKENSGGDVAREGRADIVIPINSSEDTLKAFSTTATGTTTPQLSAGSEICTNSIENAVCPVAKDSIISLKTSSATMTDFLWTIDGTPISYASCFFDGCDPTKQTNAAYFPVLKEVGSQYTVNLTATDSNTGEKVSLSRIFKVTDPTITIASADESVCKPTQLGNYIDTSGKAWPDYSATNFVGISNNPIKLKATIAGMATDPGSYTWFVNGVAATSDEVSSNGVLTIPSSQAGNSYAISVASLYTRDIPTKTALATYWNVPTDQFYEQQLSSSINLAIQDGTPTTVSAKTGKIMATIYNSTPAYLAFLLRIALTIFLILFASQLILTFFPALNKED